MNFKTFYMTEMPYGEIDNTSVDFNLEKEDWDKILIDLIHTTQPDKVTELLSIFYEMYFGRMLKLRFDALKNEKVSMLSGKESGRSRAKKLLETSPEKFIKDMGLVL